MIYIDVNHKFRMKIPWRFMVFCAMSCVLFARPEMVRAASSMNYQVVGTENEDHDRQMIDIDVSVVDDAVLIDYKDTPELKITLTNTDTEPLTHFEVSLAEPNIYELFCEEKGIRYRLLSREISHNKTDEISDKTTTLPDTLAPGDMVTVYAVPIPEREADGNQTDEVFIVYTDETGQYELPLTLVQEKKQEEYVEKTDPFTEEGEDNSEILSEKKPEFNQDEKADLESTPDDEIKNDIHKENTDGKNLVPEKETEEKDLEIKKEEGSDTTDDNSGNFICKVTGIERTNGFYMGNIFFATNDSQYIVNFTPDSSVKELNYQIGGISDTVTVKDGFAVIEVPDTISDHLEIFCIDPNQNKVVIGSEYVVNENIAPTVHYKKIEKDGKFYALVNIEDHGDIISGLMDCSVYMDGNFIDTSESSVLETTTLFGEYEVITSRQYTILLENGNAHNFKVTAKDYTGNTITENFSFEKDQKEIVNVVLPTSFNILVLPDDQGNQLYGEDIVLCNKSSFPVQVDVTSAQVQVDHSIQNPAIDFQTNSGVGSPIQNKDFDLSLQLLQADNLKKTIRLPEGNTQDVASFVLSGKNPATDFQTLQKSQVNKIDSPDYAVLNIRGTIDQNMKYCWKNDDLHVKIVFRFNKLSEID